MSSDSSDSYLAYQAELQIKYGEYLGLTIENARDKYHGHIHIDVSEGVKKKDDERMCNTRMHVEITNGVISKICGFG